MINPKFLIRTKWLTIKYGRFWQNKWRFYYFKEGVEIDEAHLIWLFNYEIAIWIGNKYEEV